MSRRRPWSGRAVQNRKLPKRETREFELADGPVSFTFQELNELTAGVAIDVSQDLIARFVEPPDGHAPDQLSLPFGVGQPTWSVYICRVIGNLTALEAEPDGGWQDGDGPYTLTDWLGLALLEEDVWREVVAWGNELLKNRGGAPSPTEPSSTSPTGGPSDGTSGGAEGTPG